MSVGVRPVMPTTIFRPSDQLTKGTRGANNSTGHIMLQFIRNYLSRLAAQRLARESVHKRRERVRAKADEMRRDMGMPPIDWGHL